MGDGKLGAPSFEVATVEKEGFSVHFNKKMKGELEDKEHEKTDAGITQRA